MSMHDKLEESIKKIIHIVNEAGNLKLKIRVAVILAMIIASFIPSYIAMIIWLLMSPEGFWQVFAIVVGSVILLGSTQLACLALCVVGVVKILSGKKGTANEKTSQKDSNCFLFKNS